MTTNEALNLLAGTTGLTDNQALNLLLANGGVMPRDPSSLTSQEKATFIQALGILSSNAEALAGVLTTKATTPAGVKAAIDAAVIAAGSIIAATQAQSEAGTSAAAAQTPAGSRQYRAKRRIATPQLRTSLAKISNGVDSLSSVLIFGDSYARFVWTPGFGADGYFQKLCRAFASAANPTGFKGAWVGVTQLGDFAGYTLYGGATAVSGSDYAVSPNGLYFSLGQPPAWVSGTVYSPGTYVTESGNKYRCLTTNTAGTFATDLAANKWVLDAAPIAVGFGTTNGYKADTATFVYKKGGGIGKWQTRVADQAGATPWVDGATVDTAGTGLGVTSLSYTLAEGTQARFVWVSGAEIRGAGTMLENSTVTSGIRFVAIDRGGLDLPGQVNTIPQANLSVLLGVWKTDTIVQCYADSDVTTAYAPEYALFNAASATKIDWLFVAPSNDSVDGASRAQNDAFIEWVVSVGEDFHDILDSIPSYAYSVAKGWQGDVTHLNSTGAAVASSDFWRNWDILNSGNGTETRSVRAGAVDGNAITLRRAVTADQIWARGILAQYGGFKAVVSTGSRVINAASMASVGTGPFSFGIWMKLPAAFTNYFGILNLSSGSGGYSKTANSLMIDARSDGGIRLEFFQGNTTDGFVITVSSGTVDPFKGRDVYLWGWRTTAGAFRFGINDSELPASAGIAGAGLVDPAQSINSSYFSVGGNTNAFSTPLPTYYAAAFWATDVDPRPWWTTGEPPAGAVLFWKMDDGAGTRVQDYSGSGNHGVLTETNWLNPAAVLTTTASLNLSTGSKTVTVTGAAVGDSVSVNRADGTLANVPPYGQVTAANTVTVFAPSTTDTSVSYRVVVRKF